MLYVGYDIFEFDGAAVCQRLGGGAYVPGSVEATNQEYPTVWMISSEGGERIRNEYAIAYIKCGE